VVAYRGGEEAAAAAVRATLANVDPYVPVSIARLSSLAEESLGDRRLFVRIAAGFGLIALLLSAAGVHAMVTFVVARQRREGAIRLALGALPASVMRRLLLQGVAPAAVGAAA